MTEFRGPKRETHPADLLPVSSLAYIIIMGTEGASEHWKKREERLAVEEARVRAAEKIFRSPHLTERQKEVAAKVAALIVGYGDTRTKSSMMSEVGTTAELLRPVLSVLSGERNESTPAKFDLRRDDALLVARPYRETVVYERTPTLQWLARIPEQRSPELHDALIEWEAAYGYPPVIDDFSDNL